MENVYVVAARFINCQSLKDSTYNFAPGLNVIKAEGQSNQTGKSVLFKMIEALVSHKSYSRSEWKDLISGRKEQAVFIVQFSDDSVGLVSVTSKGPVYMYSPELVDGKPKYIKSDYPFQEVRDKLGVIVDDTDGSILNIINQSNINRFTDSTSTSPTIVKKITTHEEVEDLLRGLTASIERTENNLNLLEAEIYKSEVIMENSRYVNVADIEPVLDLVEHAIRSYELIIDIERSTLNMIIQDSGDIDYQLYSDLCAALLALMELEEVNDSLSHMEVELKYYSSLKPIISMMDSLTDIELYDENESEVIPQVGDTLKFVDSLMGIELVDDRDYNLEYEISSNCMVLVDLLDQLKLIDTESNSLKEAESEIENITSEIKTLGREVECPIYGRIQHDRGVCVPLRN